jgi:hypothetical protein
MTDAEKKEAKRLADAHVDWYMSAFREQADMWMKNMERIAKDNFLHGFKHGIENIPANDSEKERNIDLNGIGPVSCKATFGYR